MDISKVKPTINHNTYSAGINLKAKVDQRSEIIEQI